jgi:hypothetical protein
MFKNLNYILTTDCNVIDTKNHTIYPIFRTGWTSLTSEAIKTYTNEEISVCKNINVLIRDPKDRFISGLNYYCQYKKLDLKETWTLVKNGKLIDRHFVPQFVWLMHLYKFYRGTITIKPFESIGEFTNIHKKKDKTKKNYVELLKSFIEIDYKLMKHYNETIKLGDIIKKYKNVLSSS